MIILYSIIELLYHFFEKSSRHFLLVVTNRSAFFILIKIWRFFVMYKVKFENWQKEILNNLELNKALKKESDKRTKCMSVFSYILIHSPNGVLDVKISTLYKYFSKKPKKTNMVYSNFKKIINFLSEIGLIAIEKIGRRNIYKLATAPQNLSNNLSNNLSSNFDELKFEQSSESVDNTNLSNSNIEENNILNNHKGKGNNLYINNSIHTNVVSKNELIELANKIMVEENVHASVKTMVSNNLSMAGLKINRAGMLAYITTTVNNCIKSIEACKKKMLKQSRLDQNISKYVNEKKLKFNNFEAREYDYDKLEKQLLGWA